MNEIVTIVRIEVDGTNAKVILSNGTILGDLVRVDTQSKTNDVTIVDFTAYVMRKKRL